MGMDMINVLNFFQIHILQVLQILYFYGRINDIRNYHHACYRNLSLPRFSNRVGCSSPKVAPACRIKTICCKLLGPPMYKLSKVFIHNSMTIFFGNWIFCHLWGFPAFFFPLQFSCLHRSFSVKWLNDVSSNRVMILFSWLFISPSHVFFFFNFCVFYRFRVFLIIANQFLSNFSIFLFPSPQNSLFFSPPTTFFSRHFEGKMWFTGTNFILRKPCIQFWLKSKSFKSLCSAFVLAC